MEEVILQRLPQTKYGTFGLLSHKEQALCRTLERMWFNNAENISRIPAGVYKVKPRSPTLKFKYKHFILENVKDRTFILIHRGNTIIDTIGCILVGMMSNERGLEKSTDALTMLVEKFPEGFMLTVKD